MTLDVGCRPLEQWHGDKTPGRARINAEFGGNWNGTLKKLESEIRHLGGERVIIEISGDVRLRLDGWPYSGETPEPPVAVSFPSKHGPQRYQSDRYTHWHSNVHAIALTLDRLRAIDRYGTALRGQQYTGYAALPSGSSDESDPVLFVAEILETSLAYVMEHPIESIRTARKLSHPDGGGDEAHFRTVQAAAQLLGVLS